MAATSYTGDSPLFLLDYLLRLVRVAVLLALWRTLLEGRGEVSGLSLAAVLTYTLVAEVFAEQFAPRSGMEMALWEGTSIANRFLWPMGIVGQFAAEMFGRWCFGFALFSVPLLLLSPVLGVNPLPASAGAAALFLPSLALAVSVGLALDFAFSALTVALDQDVWVVSYIRGAASTVLSGSILPLALLPWDLGEVFGWLPFASMASAPLRIYTGTGEPLRLLLVQAGWSIVLWPVALGLWRAHRERLAFFGG